MDALIVEQCAKRWLENFNRPDIHMKAYDCDDYFLEHLDCASADFLLGFFEKVMAEKLCSETVGKLGAGEVENFLHSYPDRLTDFMKLEKHAPQFADIMAIVWDDEMTPEVAAFVRKYAE